MYKPRTIPIEFFVFNIYKNPLHSNDLNYLLSNLGKHRK